MARLVALVLLFALPAFAQQQLSLVPAAEQPRAAPVAAAAPADEGPPLYTRWYVWAISGVASVAVVSAIVLVAATAFQPRNRFPNCPTCFDASPPTR